MDKVLMPNHFNDEFVVEVTCQGGSQLSTRNDKLKDAIDELDNMISFIGVKVDARRVLRKTQQWINSSFRNAGFRGNFPWPNWKTNPRNELDKYNRMNGRAIEVADYLKEFGPYDDFLLFDDSNYDFNATLGIKRWIRCDSENGILVKQMMHAMSIMGQWEKKK